ncbi:hypothetical protein NUU61_004633 [Penicillium alfredii]|uniref:CPAF-like PDZ domain-containing protein n=1 Tax=Penicillium alfredii TaxID=1506179 RepID=A0A9W9FLI1_9EURO|nr:uncharacterized protein NUU61_004633 [Penicillium alfredii]KAJ5102411.1 hypothetical protein NUU61_004633 [Penicillium alfredii]
MPFDSQKGSALIKEMRKYMEWHTMVDVLKDPPPGYASPPTDLFKGLDEIHVNATQSKYQSQLEFDAKLLASDSHRVSPVTSINGHKVELHLNQLALAQHEQDPDARYPRLGSQSPHVSSNAGVWEFNEGLWPGEKEFKIGFGNKTDMRVKTTAIPGQDILLFAYPDGHSLFQAVCVPPREGSREMQKLDAMESKISAWTASATSTKTAQASSRVPHPLLRRLRFHLALQ